MPNQSEQLSPGTALITGADRGLGFGLTQELLNRGWTVIAGRNLDWHELKELAPKFPQTLHILDLDVTSQESADAAAQAATSLISHLDILICNAGINRSAHINSIREDQNYQDMLDELNINAIGCLRVVKAFLPLMDQGNHKRLCFVSSEAGSVAASKRTGWFGYCMSKAGLNIAVKNLSNDLRDLAGQKGWNGIADLSVLFCSTALEMVVVRKGLKPGSLPNRQTPAL